MQECKNIEIFKSVKNDLGAANFKRNKITQNGTEIMGEVNRFGKKIDTPQSLIVLV